MSFSVIINRFTTHLTVSTENPLSWKGFSWGRSSLEIGSGRLDTTVLTRIVRNLALNIIFGSLAGMCWNLTFKQAVALAVAKEAGKIAITLGTEWTKDITFYKERQWVAILSGFAFLQHCKVTNTAFEAFGLSATIEITSYLIMSVINSIYYRFIFTDTLEKSFSHYNYYAVDANMYRGWFLQHPPF